VKSLARCERDATASLIAHLAELDARHLFLGAGFSSLFTYCCEVLHLSEPAACNRIEAARTARRFPVILGMLGEGSLSLATVRLLSAHLTPENHQELLTAATGKSKRQVEELLARYFPKPEVPSSVRKLPAANALLSPSEATRPAIIDRALAALLENLARRKFAATQRPRASHGTARGSRDIAAKVRRAVWLRDRGVCAFVSKSGRRCNERAFIQFHHVDSHGVGGEAMVENVQLRCGPHNMYEGVLFYGHGRPPERGTRPGKSSTKPP
jgi:hypothetical protein